MERNVHSFFKYILLPTLGCALLAINFVVGSYSAGGRDGDDFLNRRPIWSHYRILACVSLQLGSSHFKREG